MLVIQTALQFLLGRPHHVYTVHTMMLQHFYILLLAAFEKKKKIVFGLNIHSSYNCQYLPISCHSNRKLRDTTS